MGDSGASPARGSSRLRLAAEIVWTAVRVRRLVRRSDVPTAVACCRAEGRRSIPALPEGEVVRVSRAVRQILGVLPGDSSPRVSSLVLIAVLDRRGIDTSLVIGVRDGVALAPQAWVEVGETPAAPRREKFAQLVALLVGAGRGLASGVSRGRTGGEEG